MDRRAAAYSRPGREDMMKEPRYNICCPWDTQEAAQATKQREYDGRKAADWGDFSDLEVKGVYERKHDKQSL